MLLLVILRNKTLGASTKTAKKVEDPYAGTWDYVVKNTPEGDMKGEMIIGKNGEGYTAEMNGYTVNANLEDLSIKDQTIEGSFDYQGMEVIIKGKFEGNMLKGDVEVDYMTFPLEATKRMQ